MGRVNRPPGPERLVDSLVDLQRRIAHLETNGTPLPLPLLTLWTPLPAASFANGWTPGTPAPQWCIDASGWVAVYGRCVPGTITNATVVFTLPAAAVPGQAQRYPAATNGGGGAEVYVDGQGNVKCYSVPTGATLLDLSVLYRQDM